MDTSAGFELLLSLHSLLRWLVVLSGLLVLLQGVSGALAGGELGQLGKRLQLIFMISVDLQVLLGVLLWVSSPTVASAREDMGAAMKDPTLRYFAVEHGMVMLLALVVVHVGRVLARKAGQPRGRHVRTAIYAGLALMLILGRTPWPFMTIDRPWLRLPF